MNVFSILGFTVSELPYGKPSFAFQKNHDIFIISFLWKNKMGGYASLADLSPFFASARPAAAKLFQPNEDSSSSSKSIPIIVITDLLFDNSDEVLQKYNIHIIHMPHQHKKNRTRSLKQLLRKNRATDYLP
jgi:hypothetical protein